MMMGIVGLPAGALLAVVVVVSVLVEDRAFRSVFLEKCSARRSDWNLRFPQQPPRNSMMGFWRAAKALSTDLQNLGFRTSQTFPNTLIDQEGHPKLESAAVAKWAPDCGGRCCR